MGLGVLVRVISKGHSVSVGMIVGIGVIMCIWVGGACNDMAVPTVIQSWGGSLPYCQGGKM